MEKDYKSFSSSAKSRFREMAITLGYEQITGITYTKERDGWYETFNLQSSSYGNPFFYINYGIILPKYFPASREVLRDSGWHLGKRLKYKGKDAFPSSTKKEIELSAGYALETYSKEITPWFNGLTLKIIKASI